MGSLHAASKQRLLGVAELLGFPAGELERLLAMAEAGFNFSHKGSQQRRAILPVAALSANSAAGSTA